MSVTVSHNYSVFIEGETWRQVFAEAVDFLDKREGQDVAGKPFFPMELDNPLVEPQPKPGIYLPMSFSETKGE